jgi:ABC-2 type transport system permease protein
MKPAFAVVYREYLIRRTSLTWMFFDVMVPLLYLMMFGVGFDKALGSGVAIKGAVVRYNEFFLAGVLAMTCFGNAVNQAYGFFIDRDNGIFYEHLTYPLTRGELLFGKIIFQGLMSLVQTSVTLLAAVTLLHVQIQPLMLPFLFIAVILGTAGWFFCLSIVAFLIRRNDTFNMAINASYFILMFTSSLFYPIEQMPVWLRIPSMLNPLTWTADILRYLTIGIGQPSFILLQSTLFLGFLLLAFQMAVRTIQRSA